MDEQQLGLARDRITKLFQFLEAFNQLRNPVIRHIDQATFSLWLDDLPQHTSITVGWHDADAEFVLSVGRPRLRDCPAPPPPIVEWLRPGWRDVDGSVAVLGERLRPPRGALSEQDDDVGDTERFDEDPRRPAALASWRQEREEWVERELPARAAMRVFERLYGLYGQLERENGQVELVAGDALLDWYVSSNRHLHPLVLQSVQIQLEPEVPRLIVTVSDRGPELYTALLRATEQVDGRTLTQFLTEFEAGEYNPFSGEDLDGFLQGLAARLHAQGEYTGPGVPPARRESPTIGRRPVLFTRNRNQGFAVALEAILEDIQERDEFPNSLLSIVGIEPPVSPLADAGDALRLRPANEDPEILFTKPANEAQAEIARRLERYQAVMVQGPPGTGKTHTIANLIGHLLAEGKRVLVTSHTAKALERVREVIVDDLQPLAVSVVANDLAGRAQLEESVTEITRRLNDNPDVLRRRALQLSEQRALLLKQLEEARRQLLDAVESEALPILLDGAEISPKAAAIEVREGRGKDDWIPGPTEDLTLPLTVQEVMELYRTNAILDSVDELHLAHQLPEPSEFWAPDEFRGLVAREAQLTASDREFGIDAWTRAPGTDELDAFEEHQRKVDAATALLSDPEGWELQVLDAGRRGGGHRETWEHLLEEIEALEALADRAAPLVARHRPQLSDSIPLDLLRETLRDMQQHAAGGGSFGRLTLMFRREWSRALDDCSVASGKTDTPESLDALVALAELSAARRELLGLWQHVVGEIGGPAADALGPTPERVAPQHAVHIRGLLNWYSRSWEPLVEELAAFGLNVERLFVSTTNQVGEFGELLRLRSAAEAAIPRALAAKRDALQLSLATESFAEAGRRLAHFDGAMSAGGPVRKLRASITTRDPNEYHLAFQHLVDLHGRSEASRTRNAHLGTLDKVAPAWVNAIRTREAPHEASSPPGEVASAWRWRRLMNELDRRAAVSPDELQGRIDHLSDELQRCTSQLVSTRAWASQIEQTTFPQQTALKGWQEVMRRVGRGTGKRVPRLLAEARKLMGASRDAVPVWIMPLSRVVETFDFRTTAFDVVIIDEASQSDVLALTALYLGRQVVIVGDNEQVSPDAVGQRLDDVQRLIDQYLADIPSREIYTGQASIYDLGGIAFTGSVLLREHFRCVPEIIQFSNDLSYDGKILPLRDASEVALRPHVVAHHVPGVRAGSPTRAVNEEEAEFIASAVLAACEMDEYQDAKFGVISMLGEEQARLIDSKLRQHVDPAEFERRRILAGTPPQFQGDERDVIFLTLVDSPGEGPLTMRQDEALKRRYNVAASRAKDQLWVVHSLSADRDLKPGDLRERLIRYAMSPSAMAARVIAATKRAESPFEEAVASSLVRHGYDVEAQHPVGAYRIDLVVQGADRKRVAIECDGERWHPREKLAEDLARQAQLERLGWRFIRIRGSEYYRDPDLTIQRVIERLSAMGILPSAVEEESTASSGSDLLERMLARAAEIRHADDGPQAVELDVDDGSDDSIAGAGPDPNKHGDERLILVSKADVRDGYPTNQAQTVNEHRLDMDDSAPTLPSVEEWPSNVSTAAVSPSTQRLGPLFEDLARADALSPRSVGQTDEDGPDAVNPGGNSGVPPSSGLAPYRAWEPVSRLPDPRTASPTELVEMLVDLVATEGPVIGRRAYGMINRAAGGQRLGKTARRELNRAASAAVRSGRLVESNPLQRPGQVEKILRLPEQAEVLLRERGPRSLDEVPADEVAALLALLRDREGVTGEAAKRRVLAMYDLKRLTADTDSYLTICMGLIRR